LPHNVKRLYISSNEKPDTWIDIADTLDVKIEALKKHASQGDTHDVDQWMREWAERNGKEKGIKYSEAFRVMILERDEEEK
jgi:LmbE family N-acetylglucosaminyl deacetylase